jgi:hypothetical protein
MTNAVFETAAAVNWNTATVVLQLFDNSVYIVSKPGGEKQLPRKDHHGTYHIDGNLTVADKPAVKNLVLQLTPLFKELGACKKIVLTPFAGTGSDRAAATHPITPNTRRRPIFHLWGTLCTLSVTTSATACTQGTSRISVCCVLTG